MYRQNFLMKGYREDAVYKVLATYSDPQYRWKILVGMVAHL